MSYNLPKFCPNVEWDSDAITFASSSVLANQEVLYIFVNQLNNVYVTLPSNNPIKIWLQGNTNPTITMGSNTDPKSLFVDVSGNLYIDDTPSNHQVGKWASNLSSSEDVMSVSNNCFGLFIDVSNSLYCSMQAPDQVVKESLDTNGANQSVAAGIGSKGSNLNQLNNPQGIFVDFLFKLYVADRDNHRIQTFMPGNISGTTVSVNIISATPSSLNKPTGVVLDGDGYLFIVDMNNDRILRQSSYGFRCVAGCGGSGNSAEKLNNPQALTFDSYGNIFVADTNNKRIQKFLLMTNSCSK